LFPPYLMLLILCALAVYQSYRYGRSFSYSIPIASGTYVVTLQFAETYHDAAGRRKFHVSMEGGRVISDLDVYALVGKNKAHDIYREIKVSDRELNIAFEGVTDTGMICGIRITPVSMFNRGGKQLGGK
jgi:Malectin domain